MRVVWVLLGISVAVLAIVLERHPRSSPKDACEFCEIFGSDVCPDWIAFEDTEQDCYAPPDWGHFTDGCTRKGCVDGQAGYMQNICGTSTSYSNLTEYVVITGTGTSEIWYRSTPTNCTWPTLCITGGFNPLKNCEEAHVIGQEYKAGECKDPNAGTEPTGCTLCSSGGLDVTQFAQVTYATAYEEILCPY